MHVATLLSLVAAASAQTFSFGVGLGGSSDVIPAFDSQRSGSSSSSSVNPFSNPRSSGLTFEDFFSSSRVGTPKQSSLAEAPSRSSSRSPSTLRATPPPTATTTTAAPPRRAHPSPNPTITNRGAPVLPPAREATRTSAEPPRETTSSRRASSSTDEGDAPSDASRDTPSSRRTSSSPDGGAPFDAPRDTSSNRRAFSNPEERAPFDASRDTSSSRRTSSNPDGGALLDASRVSGDETFIQAQPDLSSRGRVQEAVVRDPTTRPPSTTEASEVIDVRDNLVGQSVCARGVSGDACRKHLVTTAMSCTSGFCQECQQCDAVSPDLWPRCCRDHFLCCRPLARACQACDNPVLTPFCGAAFGRCN